MNNIKLPEYKNSLVDYAMEFGWASSDRARDAMTMFKEYIDKCKTDYDIAHFLKYTIFGQYNESFIAGLLAFKHYREYGVDCFRWQPHRNDTEYCCLWRDVGCTITLYDVAYPVNPRRVTNFVFDLSKDEVLKGLFKNPSVVAEIKGTPCEFIGTWDVGVHTYDRLNKVCSILAKDDDETRTILTSLPVTKGVLEEGVGFGDKDGTEAEEHRKAWLIEILSKCKLAEWEYYVETGNDKLLNMFGDSGHHTI